MEAMRIKRGNPYQASITLTGLDGQPLNLTDVTVLFTVRRLTDKALDDTAALIKQAITDHYDPGNGQTYLDLSSEQTTLPPGTYIGDVRVVGSELKANTDPFLVEIEPIVTTRIIEESVLWGLYWDTLISATVEDAAPTDVILTFPEGKPELIDTDITATVNGIARAVSSASWTGAAWTVVLASAVEYGDVVVMTFVKTGGTTAVTNNVAEQWSSYWETRKPSDLIVTGMRNTEIDFSWTDNSAGDCSFSIYRSTDGVNYSSVGTTVAGDTTYTATGLTAGNLYYFRVVGVKSGNESDPTNVYDTYFKITIDTTKAGSANNQFVLPVTAKAAGSYFVDWGEGGAEEEFTTTGDKTHTYGATGTYQVKVRGAMTAMAFANAGDKDKLMYIDNWGNLAWSSMTNAFFGCAIMQGRYIDTPNLSAVTSMLSMFRDCSAFNQSVANFNTAKVTNMYSMFRGCNAFNQSVANFNTAAVTDMAAMFHDCNAFNQSVANFNTAKVTNMVAMFRNCSAFNQSVANFNTAKVENMSFMFGNCPAFKQSLATFSLASASNLANMLKECDINTAGTTTNYDDTLVAWAAQDVPNSLNFHGGTSKYSVAGGGAAARASLIADDLWTITDGGLA